MDRPLRIGIVGCGRILPAHLHGYKALLDSGATGFEIVALCARKQEDVDRFLRPGGPAPRPPLTENSNDPLNAPHLYLTDLFPATEARGWTDSHAMIEAGGLDVVDVTATVSAHHPVALHALSKGMHVMVQKPIARTVLEAREMVHAADTAERALGVMENVHFDPTVMMERWLVESGRLGAVQMVMGAYLGTHQWSPSRVVADTPWRHRKEAAGGGISIDLGVHFFQHLRRVCGPISRVSGVVRTIEPVRYLRTGDGTEEVTADVDDAMFCHVEFAAGGVASISASWAGHGPPTSLPGGLVIYGGRGSLHGGVVHLDGEAPTPLGEYFARHATEDERQAIFPLGLRDSFALVYLDYLRAIETGRKPSYDGLEGLMDLALSFAVIESSERHAAVTIAEAVELQ
ncbi:MAG: Gfo/Idh/MocA family oxidoreductase [Chloroflexia bacterium]